MTEPKHQRPHRFTIPVSVLVQTRNEEIGIRDCLESWKDHFTEVIVVDSFSEDGTKRIATEMGVPVVEFEWNGQYPKKKQWQIDNVPTAHGWILFVDADEYPTPELLAELHQIFQEGPSSEVSAFDIKLDYRFAGTVLRHGHTVVKRSLVHKYRVGFPVMNDLDAPGMGELEGHYQPIVDGNVRTLQGRILHDDRDPVRTWFDRHNKYSDWEAYLRTRPSARLQTRKARSLQGRVFDRLPFKPIIFFVYSYALRRGFLDGRAGFDYALALSMYYWQINIKVREIKGWSQ